MASVILSSIAFAFFWVSLVFPIPVLHFDRTIGSVVAAGLMMFFRVISVKEAFNAIDVTFVCFHIGIIVVGVYLEQADLFKFLGKMLSYKTRGGKDLICRICLISAVSSALFTSDATCIILIEFVMKFISQNNLPPEPFLLALASSAIIGSSATPIGNPQNLIIASQGGISFRKFAAGMVPAMLMGIVVNMVIILCMYWRLLSQVTIEEEAAVPEPVAEDEVEEEAAVPEPVAEDEVEERWTGLISKIRVYLRTLGMRWRSLLSKTRVYLVTLGMLIALLMEANMSRTAIVTALVLMGVDGNGAGPSYPKKGSLSLLLFFCGMFVTVEGFNKTGIPSDFWDLMEPHAQIDSATGIIVLAAMILVLSNVASNGPTVLLLGARLAASAAAISAMQETKAWLVLAWINTVAGNLTLLGSAANMIVCEEARGAISGYTLSYWHHLRFGIPSTLIVIAIGLPLIRG